jgi:tripartite-type tricarboxylate transporter receptor subunit TctC
VRTDAPWKSFQDFVDAAKKNPGKLRSGAASANISLLWEGLLKHEKIDIIHMMYKGAADIFVAIMGGHIDVYCEGLTPIVPHIEAGKIRLLAFMGSKRNKNYPDVPILKELGYSIFSRDFWSGFFASAGARSQLWRRCRGVSKGSFPSKRSNSNGRGWCFSPLYGA